MYPKGGIAFFDSGIGGLTTLSACVDYAKACKILGINYYYYGDNFRAPYGNLSEKQIFSYVDEIFFRFQALEVSAAVLACNTATAVCAEKLREKYPFPIIGIEPAILPAMREGGEIFVLATVATCNSKKFQSLSKQARLLYPKATLRIFPCENLAGEIEENLGNITTDYSTLLPKGNPTRVVLGCTHYIYIRKQIEDFYGCKTIDGNQAVAKRLFDLLFESKNRDEKPLFCEISPIDLTSQPLVTPTKNPTQSSKIFFLGDAKMVNKTKYEQMFAIK